MSTSAPVSDSSSRRRDDRNHWLHEDVLPPDSNDHDPLDDTHDDPASFVDVELVADRFRGGVVRDVDGRAGATIPPKRKKTLRHPLFTPLAKIPWDRVISAAGACDLLFNCKYSMRQVEDEVREEKRGGESKESSWGSDGRKGGKDGMEGNEDGRGRIDDYASDERDGYAFGEEGRSRGFGTREDGYANISMGNEYEEADCCGMEEDEGCNEDDFSQLVLDCCSMLDGDEDDEDVEVVMVGPKQRALLPQISSQHQQPREQGVLSDGVDGCNEEKCFAAPQVDAPRHEQHDQMGHDGDFERKNKQDCSQQGLPTDSISKDQRAEGCWRSSNPSLDMILYRQFLDG